MPPPGLESPTHALRADADPWASSATTTCVTLAERHRYDRDVEIILYPCGKGRRCGGSGGRWMGMPPKRGANVSACRTPPAPPGDGGRHHDVPGV